MVFDGAGFRTSGSWGVHGTSTLGDHRREGPAFVPKENEHGARRASGERLCERGDGDPAMGTGGPPGRSERGQSKHDDKGPGQVGLCLIRG